MMARGFKPVGWVAGVAAAALGCYMLSLNVAAERAELKKLEWRIIMAKRDIRTLQTELGTRGRLQQLESWNANVLALSAPTANQFVANEVTLARFDQREKTVEERVPLQMASAEAAPASRIQAPVHYASVGAAAVQEPSLVHRASVVVAERKPVVGAVAKAEPKRAAEPKKKLADAAPTPAKKKPALIDEKLVSDIRAAAKAETKGSGGGR